LVKDHEKTGFQGFIPMVSLLPSEFIDLRINYGYDLWVSFYREDWRKTMKTGRTVNGSPRHATNVSIDARLLEEARKLRVNISRAAEQGLAQATAEKRTLLWLEENRAALESSNEFVERFGLPLAKYRGF
jgi:antitoxin CcdA